LLSILGASSCALIGFDLDGYVAADAGASGGASASSGAGDGGAPHASSATASSGTHRPAASSASGPTTSSGAGGGSDGGGAPCPLGGFCFSAPVVTTLVAAPSSLVAADLGGDGRAQILVGFSTLAAVGVVTAPATHGIVIQTTVTAPVAGLAVDVFGAGESQFVYAADSAGYEELADETAPNGPPSLTLLVSAGEGSAGTHLVAALDGVLGVPRVAVAYASVLQVVGGQPARATLGTTKPSAIASGDLDLDGLDDVAVGEPENKRVAVLTQASGQASFRTAYARTPGCTPLALALGDLDSDGLPDIVVGCEEGSVVVASKATGTWAVVGALVGFAGPIAGVAVADLDGDGLLDVAATDATAGVVRTARGAGDGTLVASNDLDAGADPLAVVAADLDGDGRADLAVACAAPPSLLVFTAR
jgi:hypothetical protein